MYRDKKFGVFGLGISGIATINYLKSKQADFIAYDDNQENIVKLSNNYPELVNNFKEILNNEWQEIDYLVLSPGIPLTHPIALLAKKINAKIICDIELLYLDNPRAKYIGITGTNGKSTTTSLITHILKYNGLNVKVGGNIGTPVLELNVETEEGVIFVIEVSSFQLDLLDKTKFDIAILLNITPDHLDRHDNMENYTKAKYRVFAHQTKKDSAIVNVDLKHSVDAFTFSERKKADLMVLKDELSYQNKKYSLPNNNSLLLINLIS